MKTGHEGFGDLFGSRGQDARRRAVCVCVQLTKGGGAHRLLLRLGGDDAAALLAVPPGADIERLSRHMRATVAPDGPGIRLAITHDRPKLGQPLARPVAGAGGSDWLVGPLEMPDPPPERLVLLADYERQGLFPLTWGNVAAELGAGSLSLPDLLSIRAVVGDGDLILLPGAVAARRRAAREAQEPPPSAELALPLPSGDQRPLSDAGDEAPAPRARRAPQCVRVSSGVDGRIGITLPPPAMEALWAGRPPGEARRAHLAAVGGDLLVLPGGDPLASHLGGVGMTFRLEGPNWYARAASGEGALARVVRRCGAGRGGALRSPRDFTVDPQPGRVVLRGAVPAEAPPQRPPVADKLAKARQLMSEALALVRSARAEADGMGTPEIDLLDEAGATVATLPAAASAARIRLDIC